MMDILNFDINTYEATNVVYGPIRSRRLGWSLGINLFRKKNCSFDCKYCYLGSTNAWDGRKFAYELCEIKKAICQFRDEFSEEVYDVVTFCGNGEPTLHYEFVEVVNVVRKTLGKNKPMALFSNASWLNKTVTNTMQYFDKIFLKYDIGKQKQYLAINRPRLEELRDRTLVRDNIKAVIRLAKELGTPRIVLDVALPSPNTIGFFLDKRGNLDFSVLQDWAHEVIELGVSEISFYKLIYNKRSAGISRAVEMDRYEELARELTTTLENIFKSSKVRIEHD